MRNVGFVLILAFAFGCGQDNTVTAPKEIPPSPAAAAAADGGGKKDAGSSASPGDTM